MDDEGAPEWARPRLTDRFADADHVTQLAGGRGACRRWDDGRVQCMSVDLTSTRAFAAWRGSSCSVLEDGIVSCSGTARSTPPTPFGVADARAIDLGASSACAVTAAGSVWCWGATSPAASEVTALAGSQEVVLVGEQRCGRLANGTVRCVAAGPDPGELGLTEVRAIDGAAGHACALVATPGSGEVHCWSMNDAGVLGGAPNADAPFVTVPRRIEGLTGAAEVEDGVERRKTKAHVAYRVESLEA